jgi:hypothetical protein
VTDIKATSPHLGQLDVQSVQMLIRLAAEGFDEESTRAIGVLLSQGPSPGSSAQVSARRIDSNGVLSVSITLLQQGETLLYLVRLSAAASAESATSAPREEATFDRVTIGLRPPSSWA